MIWYYVQLALKSIRGTPVVSLITILAIALGIGVSTTLISVFHIFSQDPIPHKSDRLYNVRVDSWETGSEFFDVRPGDPPKHITYRDMAGLMVSDIPVYQTGVAAARVFIFPESDVIKPYQATIRLCYTDFFPMFDAPFAFGSAWTKESDHAREPVVVLSHEANNRHFGGANSVGERIRFGSRDFTIVGVLGVFRPTPQYYDVINNTYGLPHEFFIPFDLIREQDIGLTRFGDTDSWGNNSFRDNPDGVYTSSELCWIQFWVELDANRRLDYQTFVDGYAMEQKRAGRFPRPLNNHVTPLMEWLELRGNSVNPPATKAMMWISILFLLVCALNLMGLLLGKFVAKANLVGVRRALGASRRAIFWQHLLECNLVGLIGGLIGLLLAHGGLNLLYYLIPPGMFHGGVFKLDTEMMILALALSLAASLVAGLYPAWQACRVVPAIQLKTQ